MQDRVSLYPGRVKLEPVAGQANTYDLTRADQPTQEGTPLNKASLLTDGVCEILGLDHNATPNDAFLAICLPSGKYAVSVTVKSPGGRPIPNVTLSGLLTAAGNPVVTGTDGVGFGFATTSPVTVTADISSFLDLTGTASVTITPTAGVVNKAVITCTRASSAQTTLSSSKNVRFSPDVSEYDFSAIGGGFNGSQGSGEKINNTEAAVGGNGGNAGGVINQAGITYDGSAISVIVGGIGGNSGVNGVLTGAGAAGGIGARLVDSTPSLNRKASAGGNTTGFLYPPTEVGGAGGGGMARIRSSGSYNESASGGTPGGGAGAEWVNKPGSDGSRPGSGGGGGAATSRTITGGGELTSGGAGQPGLVGFMWRYQS